MSVQQTYFKPLTSLRFFAAFVVVLFHTLPEEDRPHLGYSAVSFFFVLSGFVLAIAYADRLATLRRKDFWQARFARIYPLFLLTALLDVPNLLFARIARYGIVSAAIKTAITLFATILMLQAWWPKRLEGLDNPNWSLSVEAVFYLLFPLVAAFLWRQTMKSVILLAVLIYISGLFLIHAAMQTHAPEEAIIYFPLLHVSQFVEGILLARLFLWCMASDSRRTNLRTLTFPVIGITALCFYELGRRPELIPKPFLHDGGLLLFFGPLIAVFASGQPIIDRVFSQPLLVLLGEASYGLYLIHIVVWHYTSRFIEGSALGVGYSLYLVGVVALSVLSFYFFEQPARRWLLKGTMARKLETLPASTISQ